MEYTLRSFQELTGQSSEQPGFWIWCWTCSQSKVEPETSWRPFKPAQVCNTVTPLLKIFSQKFFLSKLEWVWIYINPMNAFKTSSLYSQAQNTWNSSKERLPEFFHCVQNKIISLDSLSDTTESRISEERKMKSEARWMQKRSLSLILFLVYQ